MSNSNILEIFSGVNDPRDPSKTLYPISSLLFIALCTLLSHGEDYVDMEEFAHQRRDWLSTKIDLSRGTPSHDTFNRVFSVLSHSELSSCLGKDGRQLLDHLDQKQLCLDGKKLKGAAPKARGNHGLYILNAWVAENRLCIGQEKVGDKSNEITAIPKLLNKLDIQGSVVSIDAIGTQHKIAELIVEKEADYLLAVKGNPAGLLEEIEDSFRFQRTDTETFEEEWVYAHGRAEQRTCEILPKEKMLNPAIAQKWEKLNTLVKVVAKRQPKGKEMSTETRYYISSEHCVEQGLSPKYYNALVRGHWGIENHLHWQLDLNFREDAAKVKKGFGPQNLSALRKIALQRVSYMKDKRSLKKRRFRAALNLVYLENILNV
ncbi:MAG: ISAs1 family transposase [Ekhidna sp.]|nr:ISAs1 family transposase [Ekhidna sp.]